MHGLGNDFVVIDRVTQQVSCEKVHMVRISDRHFGVGCDQILFIDPPQNPVSDFCFRFFNPDGQEVEQCGNGVRCLAQYARDTGLIHKRTLIADTLAGRLTMTFEPNEQITVNMGKPVWHDPLKQTVNIDDHAYTLYQISTGNPHAVCRVSNINSIKVERVAQQMLSTMQKTVEPNLGFMEVMNPTEIKLRVYERGAGLTLACGSGAVAAVATGQKLNLLSKEQPIRVHFEHGVLFVQYHHQSNEYTMSGPAHRVYTGRFRLSM